MTHPDPTESRANPSRTPENYDPEQTFLSGEYGQPQSDGLVADAPVGKRNTLALIGLACAIAGTALGVFPATRLAGWVLLPIGFLLGVIALFPRSVAKTPAIAAVAVAIVGGLVLAMLIDAP